MEHIKEVIKTAREGLIASLKSLPVELDIETACMVRILPEISGEMEDIYEERVIVKIYPDGEIEDDFGIIHSIENSLYSIEDLIKLNDAAVEAAEIIIKENERSN